MVKSHVSNCWPQISLCETLSVTKLTEINTYRDHRLGVKVVCKMLEDIPYKRVQDVGFHGFRNISRVVTDWEAF